MRRVVRWCSSTPKLVAARTGYVSAASTVVISSSVPPHRSRNVAPSSASGRSATAAPGSSLTHDHVCPTASSIMRLPMNAAARARRYGVPLTSCSAPVGQPTTSTSGGNAVAARTDAGRHRIGRIDTGCAERDGDLVHDPARRADHVVLGLLAERGEPERIDGGRAERTRGRDLERRAGRHADRLRDVRRDREPRARRLDHAVAHEHDGDADHVVRPLREPGQRVAYLGVREASPASRARRS